MILRFFAYLVLLNLLQHDLKTAIFILPHAAFFALMEGEAVVQEVCILLKVIITLLFERSIIFINWSLGNDLCRIVEDSRDVNGSFQFSIV